ncbi:hypothetical protein [Lacticaseibacillus jixiensis]|uniref:hypothetical protein n=1 Tax=Lacticaseibacillus jixiensis TaxID=3231926 RepID=UPI0036F4093F
MIGAIAPVAAIISALVVLTNVVTRWVKAMTCLLEAKHLLMVTFGRIRKNEQAKKAASKLFGKYSGLMLV